MSEIESKKIATAREVMEFYARVLRGDETEEVVVAGLDGAEVVERKPQLKERITVDSCARLRRKPILLNGKLKSCLVIIMQKIKQH